MSLCVSLALSACGSDSGNPFSAFSSPGSASNASTVPAPTYSISAAVSGLGSSGLVLMVNATAVSVAAGTSSQLLASSLASGTTYTVTIQSQPTGQACTITGGSGTIASANVTTVVVTCSDLTYSVGGSISGLISSGLVLANAGDSLAVAAGAQSFTMSVALQDDSTYAVTVQAQPMGLTCSVSNGAGTMGNAAVTNIAVVCAPNTYTVGGAISGLTVGGLVLLDNGADALTPGVNASQFTMNTPVAYGSPYAITVQAAPTGLVCRVSNGTGIMGAADVTGITVGCVPNFNVLYSFAGGSDGANPHQYSLLQGSDGNFYGATLYGGTSNDGTVFEITPGGTETVLYSFAGHPSFAGMIQGSDGDFYGTTANGGTHVEGSFFQLTPSGTETDLYSFSEVATSDGPYSGVVEGGDGNFYGTISLGGTHNLGAVFKITSTGVESTLYSFAGGNDGSDPSDVPIEASDGNFYGTTSVGGTSSEGTVFKLTPGGTETVLHSFSGGTSDGSSPYAGVVEGSDGNFYGTTQTGGASGHGTVYRITPSGVETVLYSFAGGTSDGVNPYAGLVTGGDGNFYGATYTGGASNDGTVYKITPSGTETIVHSFSGSDGANPKANLVLGSDGNLYGTTYNGGADGDGSFFRIALH
ncbi:MAG TPA: choice-of-anchor tandem repeat GloVer-containing protein [Steroidobacteraceae bacterium]|nr:choice-of-anchor tandem repeat GloVer-containing protein [Steroidobacteraceae bacterium]